MKNEIDSSRSVISSYEELVKLVKHTKKKNLICIDNVELSFILNLNRLFNDLGFLKKNEKNNTQILNLPFILDNVKISELFVENIIFKEPFQINNSNIEVQRIYSCEIEFFILRSTIISELLIDDSIVHEDTSLDFSDVINDYSVKVCIEDSLFKGDVNISCLKLVDLTSRFVMVGKRMAILGDFEMDNLFMNGEVNMSCVFKQNCIFRVVNYNLEENENQFPLNNGTISFDGGQIFGELVLEFCHLNTLRMSNTPVGSVREYCFSYNHLKSDAPVIFRNDAVKKSNIILIERYTTEVLNMRLKDIAVETYRRWVNILQNNTKTKRNRSSRIYSNVRESINLLIPSLFSGEGLQLWLNKYSNDYNQSWTRGIIFTLMVTLLFYFLLNYTGMEQPYFVFDISFSNYGEVIKGYLSLLDIFNLTGLKISFKLTTWGYILLFVAKILISYGIWQTIYAFFRYRKLFH